MNTLAASTRRHRAAVAQRVAGSDEAAALDWDTLARAPGWLGLAEDAFAMLQRRIGAVLQARTMRLWIDGPRIAAARVALGEAFLARLLAQPDAASLSAGLVDVPRIDGAAQVAPLLQAAGASVLLASLPHGPLRRAAAAVMPAAAATSMAHELAATLVARAHSLAAQGEERAS